MKTDAQLRMDVIAELDWDPSINASAIGVGVKDGVVTLSGHLDTYAEKIAVQKALRRIAGVKAIALELDVRLAPDHQRSDTELATAAEAMLHASSSVPVGQVRLVVDQGWITLQGEVEWDFQRRRAEQLMRHLAGVRGITNDLTIRPRATAARVEQGIQDALARQAQREAGHIRVTVEGGTVWLRGRVNSWQERDAAQGAAWSAPGVRTVINELVVG